MIIEYTYYELQEFYKVTVRDELLYDSDTDLWVENDCPTERYFWDKERAISHFNFEKKWVTEKNPRETEVVKDTEGHFEITDGVDRHVVVLEKVFFDDLQNRNKPYIEREEW